MNDFEKKSIIGVVSSARIDFVVCRNLAASLFLIAGVVFTPQTWAQDGSYPTKVIKLIVGYAPGGGADIMGRLIARRITEELGQQVIVENRAGAGQNIATEFVAKSPPDGYTLLMSSSALGINVSLYPKINYDPIKSFSPIAVFAQSPNLFLVHPSLPVKSTKEFVAFAKKNKGALNFSSSGNGSSQHLSGELLKMMTGVEMTHIPCKGSAPSLTALVSGEVDFAFNNIPSAQPFLSNQRLRVLAITSRKRSALLPDIPTMSESGLSNFEVAAWYGVLAPSNTPREVNTKLNAIIVKAVQDPEFSATLQKMGADRIQESPEFFSNFLKREIDTWGKVIKASKAKAE